MHWSDVIAEEIVKKKPDKEKYICAAGISPSGSIHIGNFRDVATSLFVVEALERLGKKAVLLFSWDEFDRLRKVPVNVDKITEGFEKYIGYPYIDVPNPFDTDEKNYAEHFEKEFEASVQKFGIEMDYRHQAEMYRSGKYREHILTAIAKRAEIFDILDSFRTQDAVEGEREAYFPVSIYCPHCRRDTTKVISYDDDTKIAEYECKCGHTGSFDFTKDTNCKLAWKVDWPMRWMYEGVDFEPGGKDHAAPGGSYDTSRVIAEKIFGIEAPIFKGYEFIGIKGTTGKMSGSSGLNLTPDTLLKIYQPEILLWLYSRVEPNKAFDLCFDDGILRQYFEFDKMYNQYISGEADDHIRSVMQNCLLTDKEIKTVPMALLVQLGSIVDFNVPMLETVFAKIDQPYKYEDFKERLDLARYWLENCSPENANKLLPYRNWERYEELSEDERKEIKILHDYLNNNEYTLDELNTMLYDIPKQVFGENAENLKKIQGVFFKNVYQLLLNKEKGPRLYLFLYAIEKESYVRLLDFSAPKTEEEMIPVSEIGKDPSEEKEEKVEYGDPDPVEPVKEEVSLDDFAKLDLRVCRVLKCQEIRKSHSCYKLTLFDGLKERVIVSSVKSYYKPEELIGKKIIVIANLAPARITGVTSEGMLLAGTNNACGCKIIFVDDMVPEGTRIQ
ncbi:MAG: lysine--tRNA ligase [Lachnospiraceae bacterium]|nr:lysine--tRNA ligase [Lachnospiraceae bacterium]